MKKLSSISTFSRIFQTATIFLSFKIFNSNELVEYSNLWARLLGIYYLLPLLYLGFNTTFFNHVRLNGTEFHKGVVYGFSTMIIIVFPTTVIACFLLTFIYPDIPIGIVILIGVYNFLNFTHTIFYALKKEYISLKFTLLMWISLFTLFLIIPLFDNLNSFNIIGQLFFGIQILFILFLYRYIRIPKKIDIVFIIKEFNKSIEFLASSLSSNFLNSGQILIVEQIGITTNLTGYLIIQKVFSLISNLHLSYIAPFNISISSLIRKRDFNSLKTYVNRINFSFSLPILTILYVLAIIFVKPVYEFLTQTEMGETQQGLAILFGSYYLLLSLSNIYSIYLNTVGRFKFQIKISIISTIVLFIFLYLTKPYLFDLTFPFASLMTAIVGLGIYLWDFSKINKIK
jgi:hypothetical protein